uniref:PEP-CTERM sorting domain-containing protein n=1 Tax=Chamaesiphon sp. VAR_48_metabat_135_sub TaxID=2964699 RepID=UPI00286A544B
NRPIPQHPDFIPFDEHLPYEIDRFNNESQNLRISESQNLSKFRLAQLFISLIAASAVSLPIAAHAAAIYAFNSSGSTIDKFAPDGSKTTFATGLGTSFGMAVDASGNLFGSGFQTSTINKFTPGGVETNFAFSIFRPAGLAFDANGNLFLAAPDLGTIYKFASDGSKTSFATGGPYLALAFDASGNLFASDLTGSVNKFTSGGVKTTFATGVGTSFGLAVDASGNLFASDPTGSINKFTPGGVKTTFATGLFGPYGLAFDASGNLFESESGSINKFAPVGCKTIFATGGNYLALAFAPDASNSTAVPEPFTIIGTLVGGTAAIRMRKKLKATSKV